MAHSTISQIEFRPGFRQRTQCSYCDYFVDGRRLADVFEIGDFIPPFGWLAPEVEDRFARMLLRNRDSDLQLNRIPLFVCPECVHYDCGVFTCRVERIGAHVEWREFGMQYDCDDEIRQGDAERWTHFSFDATEYYHVFERFLLRKRNTRTTK